MIVLSKFFKSFLCRCGAWKRVDGLAGRNKQLLYAGRCCIFTGYGGMLLLAKWVDRLKFFSQIRWYSHANLCFRWCILSVDCVLASPYLCCYPLVQRSDFVGRSVGCSISFLRTFFSVARSLARMFVRSIFFWFFCTLALCVHKVELLLLLLLLLIFVGGNLGNLYAGSQFTVSYVRHLKSKNHDFSFISNSSILVVVLWVPLLLCGCFLFQLLLLLI